MEDGKGRKDTGGIVAENVRRNNVLYIGRLSRLMGIHTHLHPIRWLHVLYVFVL
jgi:hypothetical protein